MNDKLLSFEELQKSWWWNREEICRNGVPGVDWPMAKQAARNYELACRSSRKNELPSANGIARPFTYLELGREERTIIASLWVDWSKHPHRIARNHHEFENEGWTPAYENQYRQWNLRLTDKTLTDEFIKEIRLLRKIQKIPTPHRNQGKKHRGVSWKLVEILDQQQNKIGKLDGSERHSASVAQKLAEKYFGEYKLALEKFLKNCQSSQDMDEEFTNAEAELENPFTDASNG